MSKAGTQNGYKLVQTCYAARKYYTNSNQKGIQYDCKILQKIKKNKIYTTF